MPDDSSTVTIREVYTLVESLESKLLAEFEKLRTTIDARFIAHEAEHIAEARHRSSFIRWAVTSIITGIGVIGSIWYSVTH